MTINTKYRWAIRNKNTGSIRGSKPTREAARMSKRSFGTNYGIFDTVTNSYVR